MVPTELRIPRKLWIYWHQGIAQSPFIVRKCLESWEAANSNWDIEILDKGNVDRFIGDALPGKIPDYLSLAHQSDLIRLAVLAKYGGVWADPTTYCMQPLDDWIDECSKSGFFAYYRPASDRIMSNWFMASEINCRITCKLRNQLFSYWSDNDFDLNSRAKTFTIKLASKLLNQSDKTTRFWFTALMMKFFKVYPYFAFHYLFRELVTKDIECKEIWKATTKISASGPHLIQQNGILSQVDPNLQRVIKNNSTALYKLTWKYDEKMYSSSTLLFYLLEKKWL